MTNHEHHPHRIPRGLFALLKPLGSLWFGALALMALLVAMACATIFETRHGTEQALQAFYLAAWFKWILVLLCMTVMAAVVLRFPFTRKNLGFVLTHAAVPLIFAGALITHLWGVNGQIGLTEGQSTSHFSTDEQALLVRRASDSTPSVLNLPDARLARLGSPGVEPGASMTLGDLRIEVLQHLANGSFERYVVNDNPVMHPALEIAFGTGPGAKTEWLFADQELEIGESSIAFTAVTDSGAWKQILAEPAAQEESSGGVLRISLNGVPYDLSLADCLSKPVPVGATGLTARALRYLPHAVVGPDKKVVSGSDQPVNPAVEVEVTSPQGTDRRFAFAKFPDFQHAKSAIEGLEVLFIAPRAGGTAAVEVLSDPQGELYVRRRPQSGPPVTSKLPIGEVFRSMEGFPPFSVLRKFDHARIDWTMVAADPGAKVKKPAIQVALTLGEETRTVWLQKYSPRTESLGGVAHEFMYAERPTPLGFEVKLEKFRIVTYPGTGRPRSFESHVTFNDPAAGGQQSRVISMNHPAAFGGYTLYQSSYRQEGGKSVSFLSVARDPGQPVVFCGYIALLGGMLLVLRARITDHHRPSALPGVMKPARRVVLKSVHEEELVTV